MFEIEDVILFKASSVSLVPLTSKGLPEEDSCLSQTTITDTSLVPWGNKNDIRIRDGKGVFYNC